MKQTIGLGLMEFCISPERPELNVARQLLEELFEDEKVSLIDTADSYSWSDEDFGYGDLIVAEAIRRSDVLVSTKLGFTREGSAWIRDGRPSYLRAACEASLKRLDIESLPLCHLHQTDPNVPFQESFGALLELQSEGKIERLGVSNVTLDELRTAASMGVVCSVQNPLSVLFYDPMKDEPFLRLCETLNISLLAYAPFGGFKNRNVIEREAELVAIGLEQGLDVYSFALAFLLTLSPCITPIPGSLNRSHIRQNLMVRDVRLPRPVMERLITSFLEEGAPQ